jgi:ribosomal protein S18 acetylase RimI-like enzyme
MRRLRLRSLLLGLPSAPDVAGLRAVQAEDRDALAALMFAAYAGTIDAEPSDTLDGAAREVQTTFDGVYGPFLPAASFVVVRGAELASATLVTRFDGAPMIAFTLTAPAFARQGLGRALMLHSMAALAGAGEQRVDLAVTDGNTPAQRLYAQLGFFEVPR